MQLQSEGYRVTPVRVPLTDGTAPQPADFDAFYAAAAAAAPNDALVYACQLGGGRTTTGTVVGALLRMHLNGAWVGRGGREGGGGGVRRGGVDARKAAA